MSEISAKRTKAQEAEWFRDARFGMFIHWGLYSMLARGEWVMDREQIPPAEYAAFANEFHPERVNIDEWAQLAKRAGVRYVVFGARHHDGYALFDSPSGRFNSARTAGRDFVAEYVEAVRRAGLKVGLYYSLMSWQFPASHTGPIHDPMGWDEMVHQTHEQVRELMSNYGRIDLLWYDGNMVPGMGDRSLMTRYWRSIELNTMARSLQPHILINDRSGPLEDFDTPEQHVTAPSGRRLWEACMTINNNWGYCESDNAFKSEREILTYLLYCARYRGNLLLNIGPRQDGSVQTECIERLHGIGDWLELNGEAIYGSERHSITEQNHPFAWVTARGRKAYAHIMDGSKESARIAGIRGLIANAKILGSNTPASVCSHRDGTLDLTGLPCTAGKPAVVALELSPGARFVRTSGILLPADIPESASENGVIIVGADRGREAPPLTRTIDAQDIASGPATVLSLTGGSHWVPDWDRAVATGRCSTVEIAFHADVEGRYDLDIGVVCREPAGMTATLDGAVAPAGVQRIPGGYPATFELRNVRLAQGCHVLNLTSSADDNMIGVYGYCLSPRWQGIPSQCWATIGPFPTEFHSAAPVSTVRSAIQTQFIDEASFDPSETYRGAGNISVGWVNVHRGRGEHSQRGVDYVCRGTPRFWGVCYARTLIVSPTERDVELCFGCDWWANLWMNGKSVVTSRDPASIAEDGAMFNGHKPSIVRCRLTAGENVLLVKSHPGRAAHWITCFLNNPGDLVCKAGK